MRIEITAALGGRHQSFFACGEPRLCIGGSRARTRCSWHNCIFCSGRFVLTHERRLSLAAKRYQFDCDRLQEHLRRVQVIHEHDVVDGYGRVELPHALARKYRNANRKWAWEFVFPQEHRWVNTKTNEQGRHHVHESLLQKANKAAVRRAGLTKRVTSHTFRHSFATHLLADSYDIRTVQELLGHCDAKTTMIYTHVLNREGSGVRSPADGLAPRTTAG